jgi:hypothetical protein
MTAKRQGFVKGEWVMLADSGWYAKLVGNLHTYTPIAFVLGWKQEAGSVYSDYLVKIPVRVQMELEEAHKEKVKVWKAPLVLDNE